MNSANELKYYPLDRLALAIGRECHLIQVWTGMRMVEDARAREK